MASGGDDLSLSQTPLQQLNQLIAKVFDEESINLELNDWAIVDLLRQVSAEECIQLVNSLTTAQGNDSLLHRAANASHITLINAIIEQLSLDQWTLLTSPQSMLPQLQGKLMPSMLCSAPCQPNRDKT